MANSVFAPQPKQESAKCGFVLFLHSLYHKGSDECRDEQCT